MLAGQALKAIYKLKSNLLKFPGINLQHKFDLFNNFNLPILYYGAKHILEGRGETHNHYVYGELGRTSLKSGHAVNVIRYWFNTKYVKICFL